LERNIEEITCCETVAWNCGKLKTEWLCRAKQSTKQREYSSMGRKKTGKTVGRESSFQGEKMEWLLTFENDFRTMGRTAFYDDISKKFLMRYGYDLPFEANVEGSIEDWQPVNRKLGLTGEELAAENDFQEATRKALRLVGVSA
jgi:hypothetical protein